MLTQEQIAKLAPRMNKIMQKTDMTGDTGAVLGSFYLLAFSDDEFEKFDSGVVNTKYFDEVGDLFRSAGVIVD
jgi:hypothetical protein